MEFKPGEPKLTTKIRKKSVRYGMDGVRGGLCVLSWALIGCGSTDLAPSAPPQLSKLSLLPRSTKLPTNTRFNFAARVTRTDGSIAQVPVSWTSLGGDIDQQGGFITPEDPGDYRVIAIASFSSNLSDTAQVSVEVDTSVAAPPPSPPPPPALPPPPLPPPAPSDCGNEPAGMTWNNERAFDSKVENGWTNRGDPNFSIVSDSSAPRSAPNVGEAKYPAGFPSGRGPIATGINLPPNVRTLYVCYWIKMSPNWLATSQATKSVFFHIGGLGGSAVGRVYSALRGTTAMYSELDFQSLGTFDNASHERQISWNGSVNLNGAFSLMTRGVWKKWEILLIANTPGQYDGEAHWWLDGTKIGQYQKIGFSGPAETGQYNQWLRVNWNPTWGGAGAAVLADQYMWIDHFYISGK